MNYDLTHIFPTTIMRTSLDRDLTSEELSKVQHELNMFTLQNTGNRFSGETYVLENNLISLKKFIQDSVDTYMSQVMRTPARLKITQSWVNYTAPGEKHHAHHHQNSYLSGVFYIQATGEDDKIMFSDKQYSPWLFDIEEYNISNSKTWWLPAETGSLLLFPSSLWHEVPPTKSSNTRISLAFNTMFSGEIGSIEGLTHLSL